MVFASVEFIALFFPIFFVFYLVVPQRFRNHTLLLGSLIFYAWWSPKFLLLIIALTVFSWFMAILIDRTECERTKTSLMVGAIIINLASLVWCKYTNMLMESINAVLAKNNLSSIPWVNVVLPIGLSFTVLLAISYLVDVRRKTVRAQTSIVDFGAYMVMFPHLIAGPIVRYNTIENELRKRVLSIDGVAAGARRFMIGFSMKVLIADTLSPMVAVAFSLKNPSFVDSWAGCIAYTLQLYIDFAGYSSMAIGLGLMLGFYFHENFNHPYLAVSIQDFWRRWHMTLSSWLRDYLYISLGGNRFGVYRTYINLMLTMAIGGLWHGGDNLNYLVWGVIHGFALCCNRVFSLNGYSIPDSVSRCMTLIVVMLAWTVFRSDSLATALDILGGQFGFNGFAIGDEISLALRPTICFALLVGMICVVYPVTVIGKRKGLGFASWSMVWPVIVFFYAVTVLVGQKSTPFLYFQF